MTLLNFLNTNAGAIQGLSTGILVAITAYYAYQTKQTVEVMKNSKKERQRPRIVVFLEQREDWLNFVDLVIANYGQGLAKEVTFKLKGDINLISGTKKLSELSIIKYGFKDLPPQKVKKLPLVSLVSQLNELEKKDLGITVNYQDMGGIDKYSDTFSLDFKSLIENQLGTPPIYKISEGVEKIAKSIEKINRKIK
jgi:hypothetical protein